MNYWTQEHEQAVIEYQNSTDELIRHKIYTVVLYPVLKKMAVGIFNKYFLAKNQKYQQVKKDWVQLAMIRVYEGLNKFAVEVKAKAYSYLQTIIKNSYWDSLRKLEKNKILTPFSDIVNDEGDGEYFINSQPDIVNELILIDPNRVDDLFDELKFKTDNEKYKFLIDILRQELKKEYVSRFYLTYFLMKMFGFTNSLQLYQRMTALSSTIKYSLVMLVIKSFEKVCDVNEVVNDSMTEDEKRLAFYVYEDTFYTTKKLNAIEKQSQAYRMKRKDENRENVFRKDFNKKHFPTCEPCQLFLNDLDDLFLF